MRFVRTAENLFGLPQGFTRVEYLETSASKYYIDTGYKANNTTKVEIKTQGQTWTFGGRTSLAVGDSLGICFNANLVALQFGGQSINYNQTGIAQQVSECVISQDGAYINGVLLASFTSETFSCPNNLYLFDINNNGSLGDGLKGKMWYCKIWDNNTLVRDLIPCIDPLGVACMYDLVGKKPYYNQGIGTFTAGRKVIPVDYLESTGTQYIDTGVGGDLTTELTCEAAIVQAGNASVTNIMGNNVTSTRAITINMSANISNPSPSRIRFGNTDNTTEAGAINLNTFYKYDTNKNKLTVRDSGGVVLNTYSFNATTAFTTNGNILIFKLGDTSTQYIGKIKVKGATIKNNGVLVRDFIPCKDENNVGFMFDTLSGTVYLNAGTGAFSVGENKYISKLRLIKDTDGKIRFIQDVIPSAYLPLKYLESTGTQYIDLGVGVKANTVFKATFSIASTATGRSYFGARNSTNERFQIVNSIGIGGGYYLVNTVYPLSNQKYEIEMHANGDMYLDGVKRSATTGTFSQVAFERNLWLFATNYYDSSVGPGASTFWKAQIFEGDTVVRDLYPSLRKSDNKPGMYDRITKQFYVNQGTGEFNYG